MELVLIKLTSLDGIPAAEIVQAAHSKAVVIARLQVIPIALFLILTSCSKPKDPDTYCPIPGSRSADYRGGNRQFVNCKEDGTCVIEDTPKADTCCGNCQSCTYNNCCHCSFTDPAKFCPIPGWRSEDYVGDGGAIQPRGTNDPGR